MYNVTKGYIFLCLTTMVVTLKSRVDHFIVIGKTVALLVRPETIVFGADLCFTADVLYFFDMVSPSFVGQRGLEQAEF